MTGFHYRTISVLLVSLLFLGIAPVAFPPGVTSAKPAAPYAPSAIPWTTYSKNMNVTTYVSPDGSRDQLWHFLNSAQQSIYVEIFGINNPYIVDLIHQIHAAKPSVHMKFLIGWNSLGYVGSPDPNHWVAYNLSQAGFPVKWTKSADFTYAHQKFIIIDNKTTIVQSGNWAKTSFPESGKICNREWNIAMTDVDVTAAYRAVFDYDWGRGKDYSIADGTGDPLTYTEAGSSYPRPFLTAGTFSGQMNVTPIFSPDTSLQAILYCMNNAQVTLDIQIPYFTSVYDGGQVDQVISAIVAAKNRGVTVRIITVEDKDWGNISAICWANGIPIAWQDETWFAQLHNKGIIVDGRLVLICSINFSDESIAENREAGVIIQNQNIAEWYQAVYDYDWSIASADVENYVNLYWHPNIPKSTTAIDVTVYAEELFASSITQVILSVKIGAGAWTNHTVTSNAITSPKGHLEFFTYQIPAQPDGTNITVLAYVQVNPGTPSWYQGFQMVIHVRDALGSLSTTTTTTSVSEIPWTTIAIVAIAVVIVLVGGTCFKKK